MSGVIYLDNAASTWPKPPEVTQAMTECLEQFAANPGRGGHTLSVQAGEVVQKARKKVAALFSIPKSEDIAFFSNATVALNQAIFGLLDKEDHVITTTLEHNSVRRPLEHLKKEQQITVSEIAPRADHTFDIHDFQQAVNERTKLIVVTHASNLLGAITPIEKIGRWAREQDIVFLVDASQSAGVIPIDVEAMNIDMLAFPGHKGLYGSQGTGGLYIHPRLDLTPLIHGGTGSQSEKADQPHTRPERYESGTLNTVGLAGLAAGVDFVLRTGVDAIRQKEWMLASLLMKELKKIERVVMQGPEPSIERTAVVSFYLEGIDVHETAFILDQHFQIAVRAGYHCTPAGHETAGTFAQGGTVRASFGYFNTEQDVMALVEAVKEIIAGYA